LFPASHVSAVLPIVLRALSKDPVKRFSDIQTFANQFEEAYKQATHDTSNRLKRRFVVALAACLLVLISLGIPLLSLSQAVSHTSIGHVQTSTPNFQATQTAAVQLYQRYTSSVPDIDATLKDQDSNEWQVIPSSTSSCVFTNSAYQASTQQVQTYMPCLEQAKMCKNCACRVELMIVKGYYGGVTVRADPVQQTGYYFMIGPDDSYKFGVLNGRVSHSLRSGLSPVINNKANQWNQLTVITRNNQLSFYINQRYIDQVSDSTFLQGMVGMVAEDLSDADGLSHPPQVMFRNVRLWSLP